MHDGLAGFLAFLSGIIAFVFDVPAPFVFAAFAGAYAAVFFGEPTTRTVSAALVVSGTFVGAWGVALVIHNPQLLHLDGAEYTARAIAGALGFVAIYYRRQLTARLGAILGGAS